MRSLRGPIAAFTLAAVYGLTFGPLLILVGLFTGPPPLIAGVIHLAIGLASLAVIAALGAFSHSPRSTYPWPVDLDSYPSRHSRKRMHRIIFTIVGGRMQVLRVRHHTQQDLGLDDLS